eukprot:gnl/MRDRNA2_/MRDRNA2_98834_c0_seq1.p1 gnl/MRDRNA2_/MRDRNA2_98834_c0~~gnl/MRDRNA2_/MRDRNA2_98834_c0_seq1.p1  ORF type:complete len:913 (+),score=176.33 gnl/MRDRNA2_/MRDRNA2_98834_c0_seq1:114-2852(+)
MGCGTSAVSKDAQVPKPEDQDTRKKPKDLYTQSSSLTSLASTPSSVSNISAASSISDEHHKAMHKRLRKLQELDASTKVPFILVELRGLRDGHGFIEICGKDEYGVYAALDEWLVSTWGCSKLDAGDLTEDTMVPFCDALYSWSNFKLMGNEGTNNMGLATMQLVDFMAGKLGWTLGVVNGGNVGAHGEIREQQIIFKSPHPMNFVAPHFMIELRSAGYIEVCGDGAGSGLTELEQFFKTEFAAEQLDGFDGFCDRCYKTGPGAFKERGNEGENNLGLLTTQVCDAVVRILPGWSLVTCNGGNYGEAGNHREQQLVFRWDNHPLQAAPHLLVELRDAGYIEVCGENADNIYSKLKTWLKKQWGCGTQIPRPGQEPFANAKLTWTPRDMMTSTGEITSFFHSLGWQMQVCSQGTVKAKGSEDSREQQIIFRPGASGLNVIEPHLIIEMYMGEGREDLSHNSEVTQVLAKQKVRLYPIGDCTAAMQNFQDFILKYMGGCPTADGYECDVFLQRGEFDNNLGQWTMRVCDFMVDRLGWSFIVCNVCNLGTHGNLREQQLIFRYDGERREMPKADTLQIDPMISARTPFPSYWTIPEVIERQTIQDVVACQQEEIQALQDMFDSTFRRVLTRDRVYEYQASSNEEMPFRLEVVHAFRSENGHLWHRFQQRKSKKYQDGKYPVKTLSGDKNHINERLGNSEAYLFHGTNPSSSMSILKTGFALSNAGKSTGTMFGYGTYLAECCSKSDEYARDDGGNTYPGLCAMLVCRAMVGTPLVVDHPGDYISQAKSQGFDCIVGDRESKVGTYKEFVFFDESQIIPEYTVIYRRQYLAEKVPQKMRRKPSGTTGRFWQVKFDKGWGSVAPETNRRLLEMMKNNESVNDIEVGDQVYTFDLAKKTQLNKATGTSRALRPPMVMP